MSLARETTPDRGTVGGRSRVCHLIDPARLRERRMAEARAATARLGVSADRVHFLKHPDGALERVHADLANGLRALIGQLRPAQIFVPHADEPPPDHRAARSAALDALAAATGSVQMLEYPVWWWLHWPWARLSLRRDGVARSLRKRTLETAFGTNTTGTFNRKVAIGDLLDQKRAALGEHVTQMTRPPGLAAWPILAEIAGGDFLNCLLADAELFHAYHVEQGRRRDDD